MSEIVDRISETENLPGRFAYRLTDITEPQSVKEAADTLDGNILMCCEGLLIYLGLYEYESMLSNISLVLHMYIVVAQLNLKPLLLCYGTKY